MVRKTTKSEEAVAGEQRSSIESTIGAEIPRPRASAASLGAAPPRTEIHGVSGTILVMLDGRPISTEAGKRVYDLLADAGGLTTAATTPAAATPAIAGENGTPNGVRRGSVPLPVLGAVVNGRLRALDHVLVSNCTVKTVEFGTKDGTAIYIRTAILLLCEAVREIDPNLNPVVGQSLAGGYSFTVRQRGVLLEAIDPGLIRRVKKNMLRFVAEDRPVVVRRVAVEEALEYFRQIQAWDKAKLLETTRRAEIQWASVGNFRDLVTGPLALSAGVIREFDLIPYATEMVLRFPGRDFRLRPAPKLPTRLYTAYREARRWNDELGISNVGQLNEAVIRGHVGEVIRVAEGFHEKKVAAIADEIAMRKGCRLVLVAGPSSSGKTTFTKRLCVQLRVLGLRPIAISMDNYYVNRCDTPKHADGSYNFECLEALDVVHFNQQVQALIRGENAETPRYSFTRGMRVEETTPMELGPREILITEGIHCLNPRLTEGIQKRKKFSIYVSALTQLSIDDHSRIFTADVRLLRRLVRDRMFRGYTAEDTLRGWPSVRSGENRYIFPFQENADTMFNSALVYEPAVIRTYAERFLLEVPLDSPVMSEAYRLLRFLHLLVPLFSQEVPQNSLLREFIGGSSFDY